MLEIIGLIASLVLSYYGGAVTERETGGAVTATIYTDGNYTKCECDTISEKETAGK